MSAWRTILLLAIVLAALVAGDAWLSTRDERSARDTVASPVSRMLASIDPSTLRPGAIRLSRGKESLFFSNRRDGIWRCENAFGAVADIEAMERLVTALVSAEGTVRDRDPARAEAYGLGRDDTIRIALLPAQPQGPPTEGPEPDPLFTIEIGLRIPDEKQCFARVDGEPEIWALESDVLETIAVEPGSALPPLVDARVLPPVRPDLASPPRRIAIQRADGQALELERTDRAITSEEKAAGALPWTWSLRDGNGAPLSCQPALAESYARALTRAPLSGLVDPRSLDPQFMTNPAVRVTLFMDRGKPIELRFGPAEQWGVPVHCTLTRTIVAVTPAVAELLHPGPGQLAESATENPWLPLLEPRRPPG
ncbi:MAG: DUF4340 domain-containing protein [Phycisphaerales bacterium]